jgi:cytochrome c2/predicted  nucleic acid-binding Zn-ribbon protein
MSKMNIAFLLGGLLLMATWAWAIYDDYSKPYKEYQRRFYEVYAQQLRLEKKAQWSASKERELQQKRRTLNQLQQKIEARGGEVDQLEEKLKRLRVVRYQKLDGRVKTINSKLTPVGYDYSQAVARAEANPDYDVPESLKERFKELKQKYDKAVRARERLRGRISRLEQKIKDKKSRITEIESEIRNLTQKISVIESTLNRVEDSPLNLLLDAPFMNFIKPRIDIRQYQVSGIYLDYNFDLVPRRDFCKSCHMGIDNPVFQLDENGDFQNENTRQAFQSVFPSDKKRERMKEVFKAHPRFELFGESNSKYRFSEYGCTGCHMGDGRALTFTNAAHTPDNKKERKEWKRIYDWHPRHYWGEKMLKGQFYEAGFKQFYPYGSKVDIPNASKLNEGRDLWRKYGCNNCHAVEGMNYQRKVGFSLDHIGSKLEKDWVRRWVEMPTDFDPTARMPRVFHRSNISSAYHRELSTVVIESISTYLFEQSRPIDLQDPPAVPGDPERGEHLTKTVGCYGCHSMVEEGIKANTQAPDLSNVGTKLNRRWLYNWLRNPREVWSETHMPDMKLTQSEANDITAYLMDQTAEDWNAENFPTEIKGDTSLETLVDNNLNDIAKKFLGLTRGPAEVRRELNKIKSGANTEVARERQLKMFVGERAVNYFGCASCHSIPGHEGKNRIGAELTGWANKSSHKLAFNFVEIPHTRQDFAMLKLKQPGIYDRGLTKSYLGKLRMPNFDLSREEREKIVTHLMSLKADKMVDPSKQFDISAPERLAYEGNKLIDAYNCQGCHTMDEESPMTDYLMNYYENQLEQGESYQLGNNTNPSARTLAQAHVPPTLTNVGRRLSQDWLFDFLKEPDGPNGRDRIRTWQHVRMPNFQFPDEEASTISEGLAYAGWNKMPPKISPEGRQTTPEKRRVGRAIFNKVCSNCHIVGGNETFKAPQMTPNLGYLENKFHYEGFIDWIEKPSEMFVPESANLYRHQGMIPYTKVPARESFLGFEPEGDFSTKEKQMEALRDYIFHQGSSP